MDDVQPIGHTAGVEGGRRDGARGAHSGIACRTKWPKVFTSSTWFVSFQSLLVSPGRKSR